MSLGRYFSYVTISLFHSRRITLLTLLLTLLALVHQSGGHTLSPHCAILVQHEVYTPTQVAQWHSALTTLAKGVALDFTRLSADASLDAPIEFSPARSGDRRTSGTGDSSAGGANVTNVGALLGLRATVAPIHSSCAKCKGTHANVYKVDVEGPGAPAPGSEVAPRAEKRSDGKWGLSFSPVRPSLTIAVVANGNGEPTRWIPSQGAVFKPNKCNASVQLDFTHASTTYAEVAGYRLLAWLDLLTTPPTIFTNDFHIPASLVDLSSTAGHERTADELVCSGSLQAWAPGGRGFLWSNKERRALPDGCKDDTDRMFVSILYWIGNWDMNQGGRVIDGNGVLWAVDNSEILVPSRWRYGEYPFLYRGDPDGPHAQPTPGWSSDSSFPLARDSEFVKMPHEWSKFSKFASEVGMNQQFASHLFVKRGKLRGHGIHIVRDWHGGVWVQRALTSNLHNHTVPHPLVVRHLQLLLQSPRLQRDLHAQVADIPFFTPEHFDQLLARARELVNRFMAVEMAI